MRFCYMKHVSSVLGGERGRDVSGSFLPLVDDEMKDVRLGHGRP